MIMTNDNISLGEEAWNGLTSSDPAEISQTSILPEDWLTLQEGGMDAYQLKNILYYRGDRNKGLLLVRDQVVLRDKRKAKVAASGSLVIGFDGFSITVDSKVLSSTSSIEIAIESILAFWKFASISHEGVIQISVLRSQGPEESRLLDPVLDKFVSWLVDNADDLPSIPNLHFANLSLRSTLFERIKGFFGYSFHRCHVEISRQSICKADHSGKRTEDSPNGTMSVFLPFLAFSSDAWTCAVRFQNLELEMDHVVVHLLPSHAADRLIRLTMSVEDEPNRSFLVPVIAKVLSSFPRLQEFDCYCQSIARSDVPFWEEYGTALEQALSRHSMLKAFEFCLYNFHARSDDPHSPLSAYAHRNKRLTRIIAHCERIAKDSNHGGIDPHLLGSLLSRCQDSPTMLFEVVSRCVEGLLVSGAN